jgi:predicted dehydrogenase
MALRIGILAAARIANAAVITPARLVPGVRVTAIAARDPARARAFAQEHGLPGVAASYQDLVARDDVDLVYVASPPALHAAHARLAIDAGKPVLLEKPSAANAAETRAIVDHARARNVRLIEAFHYRHHPVFVRVLDILRRGEIGTLTRGSAVFNANIRTDPDEIRWRADLGGGALMDLGCYCVHWLRHAAKSQAAPGAGEPALTGVEARVDKAPSGVDVTTEARLQFGTSFEAIVQTSMQPADGVRRAALRLEGTDGSLEVTNPLAPQFGHDIALTRAGKTHHESLTMDATFTFQLAAVKHALASGDALPTEGEDMIANMETIDAIYRAGGFVRG